MTWSDLPVDQRRAALACIRDRADHLEHAPKSPSDTVLDVKRRKYLAEGLRAAAEELEGML